mmetsp:Transcript_30862/g.80942  ORF Transcript_30862/g.80942 Transcript_30862/m.80942 type:complete len:235 (+) Transcript_30862:164-868(+)
MFRLGMLEAAKGRSSSRSPRGCIHGREWSGSRQCASLGVDFWRASWAHRRMFLSPSPHGNQRSDTFTFWRAFQRQGRRISALFCNAASVLESKNKNGKWHKGGTGHALVVSTRSIHVSMCCSNSVVGRLKERASDWSFLHLFIMPSSHLVDSKNLEKISPSARDKENTHRSSLRRASYDRAGSVSGSKTEWMRSRKGKSSRGGLKELRPIAFAISFWTWRGDSSSPMRARQRVA